MSSVGPTLYRGTVAPTTGREGDLWIDTSTSPATLQFCLDNSPTWSPLSLGNPMEPTLRTTYATPGTGNHTIADGTWVRVTVVGGGGGGGGKGGGANVYAAGGGGGHTVTKFFKVSGTSIPYKVGSGGNGGSTAGSAGASGGTSFFGPVAAMGGLGGAGSATATTATAGGFGGGYQLLVSSVTTSIGSYNVVAPYIGGGGDSTPGGAGGDGYSTTNHSRRAGYPEPYFGVSYVDSSLSLPGSGGCSVYGLGGVAVMNQTGVAGSGYGGGGAGAGSTSTTDYTGGAGAGGVVIIEEFGVW